MGVLLHLLLLVLLLVMDKCRARAGEQSKRERGTTQARESTTDLQVGCDVKIRGASSVQHTPFEPLYEKICQLHLCTSTLTSNFFSTHPTPPSSPNCPLF